MNSLRAIREATGLCVQCGAIPDRLGMLCSKCNERAKLSNKKTVKKRHERKICVHCSKPLDRSGWICKECRKKASTKEYERRKQLKEQGLCVQCETPSNGYRLCDRCRNMKYEARARQKEAREKGIVNQNKVDG